MMEIDYINGVRTDKIFGMSKYQMEIVKRLDVKFNVIEYDSLMYKLEKKFNQASNSSSAKKTKSQGRSTESIINLAKYNFKLIDKYRYTRIVKNNIKEGNIKHVTSQELAYLLNSLEHEWTIVTCYDLIPWIYNHDRSSLWKENIKGLKRADCIVTISKFSKSEIVKYLEYPEDKIRIVYPGVDHSIYKKDNDKRILDHLNIEDRDKIVMYVGSETPRMNFDVLLKAFAEVKKRLPDVKLIKIGESQSYGARESIVELIDMLGLKDDVIFTGYVAEEYMPKWYNSADVLVYPCDYAGFGLPPLEAMACGTPVITSNTSSLPEVVGDAGVMVDPKDHITMAEKIVQILEDDDLRSKMVSDGFERAKMFSWEEASRRILEIYRTMKR